MLIFKKKILNFVIISISLVVYGIGIGKYNFFPFYKIQKLQDFAKEKIFPKSKNFEENNIKLNFDKERIENNLNIKFKTQEEFQDIREYLIRKIIPKKNIAVNKIKNDQSSDFLTTKYYGINSKAILHKSTFPKQCLRIYIQGHGGNPLSFEYHKKLKNEFLNKGCDMLSMSMIGIGLNRSKADFPTHFGRLYLTKEEASNHNLYSDFQDKNNKDLDPLTLFLYPHYAIIKEISSNYKTIAIMGISGGGWQTVMLGALLPEINTSISISGSIPFAYKHIPNNRLGDWEDVYSPIYKEISYFDLYQLMTLDSRLINNRNAYIVYNANEPNFFKDPWATHFKKFSDSKPFLKYKVIIDKNNYYHVMNPKLIKQLLKNN